MQIFLDQVIIYIFIFVFASLVLFFVALVIAYVKLINRYLDLKQGKDKGLDPQELIAKANLRSQKILQNASLKAQEIIAESERFLEREDSNLSLKLDKINEIYVKRYSEALQIIQEETLKILQNIPNDLKVFLISAVDDFRATLTKDAVKAQDQITKSLQESLVAAQHELEKYKEARKRQVDEEILNLVVEVTKRVLGKEISLDEHEKLVLKSLEEAKREKLFV